MSVYPSKIDGWFAAILLGMPLFILGLGCYLAFVTAWWAGLLVVVFGVMVAGIMACLSLPCRYTLTDRQLVIQCGWDEDHIDLTRIKDAFPSYNPLSAPALSLRRVKIILDNNSLLISPVDRERFLQELKARVGAVKEGIKGPERPGKH